MAPYVRLYKSGTETALGQGAQCSEWSLILRHAQDEDLIGLMLIPPATPSLSNGGGALGFLYKHCSNNSPIITTSSF